MGLLDGRIAIVTGGGRGIGRSHCLELASHGACVVVNDPGFGLTGEVEGQSPADEVVAEITRAGGLATSDRTSVSDYDGVRRMIMTTVARYGQLDIIVNNAGIIRDAMITSMTEHDWDAVIDVHLKGSFCVTKHACDHWRSRAKAGHSISGRIINTTSGAGLFGNIGQASYGAAKAAIANLTMITAMEMSRYGVTANAISPLANTRMTDALPQMRASWPGSEWDPMDPSNSSPVVAWLASVESSWLSGAILRVVGNTVSRVQSWTVDAPPSFVGAPSTRLKASDLDFAMRKSFGLFPTGIV